MVKLYYPYPANDGKHKYYIIINSGKTIKFGQASASDFTIHKDEARKQRYINRHKNNETWSKSGIDTAGFWSRWLLWNLPTKKDSYMDIKRRFNIQHSMINMYIKKIYILIEKKVFNKVLLTFTENFINFIKIIIIM